jgi:hypothetical protein
MKMKPAFLTALVLAYVIPAQASERTTLQVETRLFATATNEPAAKDEKADLEIVVFARLLKPGLGRGAAEEGESLKRFFNLPALALKDEARTSEITWSEDYQTKKGRLTFGRRVRLGSLELMVVLIPEVIGHSSKSSLFRLEIHQAGEGQSGSLDVLEKVLAKDVSWNFEGPLVLGFFLPGETYFLTVTVHGAVSFFGGTLGGGVSWTL